MTARALGLGWRGVLPLAGWCLALFGACGSDDAKKNPGAHYQDDAGQGGDEAGATSPSGGHAGGAGNLPLGGEVGASGGASAGTSNEAGAATSLGGDTGGGAGGVNPAGNGVDAFVSPDGIDAGNDCFDEQTPCATLRHAADQAGAGGRVWLLDGAYDATNQGATIVTLPEGTRLHGRNPAAALLQVRLDITGGEVHDVIVDRTGNTVAGLKLLGGNVRLEAIALRGAFPFAQGSPLQIGGSTIATLTPGSVTNYAAEALPTTTANAAALISLSQTAELTITGGSLDSDAAGPGRAADDVASAIAVADSAHLVVSDFTLGVVTRGIRVTGTGRLEVSSSTIFARSIVSTSYGYGVWVSSAGNQVAEIDISDTTLKGFTFLPPGGGPNAGIGITSGAPNITLRNVTLTHGSQGLYGGINSSPAIIATDLTITDNAFGGVQAQGSMKFWGDGGVVRNNNTATVGSISPHYGGLSFISQQAPARYDVRLRNFQVVDNRSVGSISTNANSNSGFYAAGNAMSSFDLGTKDDPGGNTFTGNFTTPQAGAGAYTTNVYVTTPVTVFAVGNTFDPNAQGADADGHYALGVAPCGAASCDLTSGSGPTFHVVAGALRLAE